MPATPTAQRNLMAAAQAGAKFPMANKVRLSMTPQQIGDFVKGPAQPAAAVPSLAMPSVKAPAKVTAKAAPKAAAAKAPAKASAHPGGNLGQFLHPSKGK